MADLPRRPCLALPFTIIGAADGVHLLAGEDWRYVVSGSGLAEWLPAWLALVDGTRTLEILLAEVPVYRDEAEAVLLRLQGERLLREGPVEAAHAAFVGGVEIIGAGELALHLAAGLPAGFRPGRPPASRRLNEETSLALVTQESLDYATALEHNARLRSAGRRWLWVCSGAMTRGYVGPLFLPDAGPCLACLVGHFRRLSPAPHLYDLLQGHGDIKSSPLPPEATRMLAALAVAKLALATEANPRPALYRLHVLEAETLDVTSHAVPRDPDCPVCGKRR